MSKRRAAKQNWGIKWNLSNVICCTLRWSFVRMNFACAPDKFNLARLLRCRTNRGTDTNTHAYTWITRMKIEREKKKGSIFNIIERKVNRFHTYTQITHGFRIKRWALTRHNPHFTLKSTLNVSQKPITWQRCCDCCCCCQNKIR